MTHFLAGPPVIRSPAPLAGGGGKASKQPPRKGTAAFSTLIEAAMPYRYAEQARLLSNSELWQVYSLCPDVRAAIDATVLKVSTWDWRFKPRIEPNDPRYESVMDACEGCRRFFAAPNTDGETYQEWTSKLMRDLLVFDALCVEHVRDTKGKLIELVALRGGDVTPIVDTHQRLIFYKQINQVGQQVDFEPEEVTYLNLFPNTTAPGGKPLIETLITEIITMMRQAKHIMQAYDADEVPPGILALSGVAGKAGDRITASLQNMKGNDQKLRIVTFDDPKATGAQWIELRRSFKDMDLKEVVKEVRRTIWRVFHVKPITMGDSESTPRATAAVQLEAEEDGLIIPFLELWEQKINARIVPGIVGDTEMAALIEFSFDREKRKSGEEEKAQADADASDMELGAMTINERRHRKGLPPIAGGDVARIKDQSGWIPLAPPSPAEDTPAAGSPNAEDAAPGEASPTRQKAQRFRHPEPRPQRWLSRPLHDGCTHEPHCKIARSIVPESWNDFDGQNTVDLQALGEALRAYHREITPLYQQIRVEVIAAVRAYLSDDRLTEEELPQVIAQINRLLERLGVDWSLLTAPLYKQAARIGRDAAVTLLNNPHAAEEWQKDGDLYHTRAMGYLWSDRGILSDLKAQLQQLMVVAVRSRQVREAPPETAELLAMVRGIFDRNEHRIGNWAGKLIELASMVAARGIESQKGDEWQVQWVNPTDDGECPDCRAEHKKGVHALSELQRYPAGALQCGGRCRCVLVFSEK